MYLIEKTARSENVLRKQNIKHIGSDVSENRDINNAIKNQNYVKDLLAKDSKEIELFMYLEYNEMSFYLSVESEILMQISIKVFVGTTYNKLHTYITVFLTIFWL